MKNKKILLVILPIIIVFFLVIIITISLIMLSHNKNINENTASENNITEIIKNDEDNLTRVTKYLGNNYDKFTIDGSTSMIPLHQSLTNSFGYKKETIHHNKTVESFEKFISGENDILLGVDYSDELLAKAKNSGIDLVKKEVTREAFVFLINKNNPVKNLTIEQIKNIYSGKITNWSQVGGDDAPINAYQRNSDSGSQIRMQKFMGNTKLMENDVNYISSMGYVIEQISDYDKGKYSIAYNIYTFTEKQYANDEVILLDVNSISPNDDTIFNETYPITIYNYIYYDKNNSSASEFANNLYNYLMSDEGQKLISNSGYVNLNEKYDRNTDINNPYQYENETILGFYNKEKNEFYDTDKNENLLIYKSFPEYILHDTKYERHSKARNYLTFIFNSDIPLNPYTAYLDEAKGSIRLNYLFDAAFDPEDLFNIKYNDKYYTDLTYFINEDKYVLTSANQESFDIYFTTDTYLNEFSEYLKDFIVDSTVEITIDDFNSLYMQKSYNFDTKKIEYFQPFK